MTGSLVALTPTTDMFQRVCKVAVVAARPLSGLLESPPSVHLIFGNSQEIEIDPQCEWLMVEASQGYFEAYRHTLKALQKLYLEKLVSSPLKSCCWSTKLLDAHQIFTLRLTVGRFPLSEHIINVQKEVPPPKYLVERPFVNLSPALAPGSSTYVNVDVLSQFPRSLKGPAGPGRNKTSMNQSNHAGSNSLKQPIRSYQDLSAKFDVVAGNTDAGVNSIGVDSPPTNVDPSAAPVDLDESQLDALCRMITKQVAVVQGPPGTGKTSLLPAPRTPLTSLTVAVGTCPSLRSKPWWPTCVWATRPSS
jgi:hypothetical protein